MQLKVEFTDPHRDLVSVFQRPIKELLGSFHHDFRRAAEGAEAVNAFKHFTGGAATAVTVAEGHEGNTCVSLVLEVFDGVSEVLAGNFRTVGVHRREVRKDSRSINAFPQQSVVREGIDLVP